MALQHIELFIQIPPKKKKKVFLKPFKQYLPNRGPAAALPDNCSQIVMPKPAETLPACEVTDER